MILRRPVRKLNPTPRRRIRMGPEEEKPSRWRTNPRTSPGRPNREREMPKDKPAPGRNPRELEPGKRPKNKPRQPAIEEEDS